MVSVPQAEPSSAETMPASSSAKSPAPALRTTSGASTAGSSQTPYMTAWAGGKALKGGSSGAQRNPQAQKTAPKATPRGAGIAKVQVGQRAAAGGGSAGE